MSSLLFADDAVLFADGKECLRRMVNEMGVVCNGKLGENVNKSKVVKVSGVWNVTDIECADE